ncbi:MAG: hypothetical protein ACLP52_11820 [Streptosporangiaceae bacterium]
MSRAWVITALSASVTLILGALLGALPALLVGSWDNAQTRDQTWVLIGFAVISGTAAVTAITLSRKRRWVLTQNGTAYVIQELAADWARQDEKAFLDSAGRYFARVIKVPGPGQLGWSWDWPLDDRGQQWDAKVTELARSFQAIHHDDDPATPNGILMWTWWAVAAAFGMRVTAADRDLVLDVWQRPSHGRAGEVETVIGSQRPHRFGLAEPIPLAQLLPQSAPREITWPVKLTITSRLPGPASPGGQPVSVLLLRLGQQKWGPLPEVSADPDPGGRHDLKIADAAGLLPGGSPEAFIHELRCVPPAGGQFPWPAVPSLVAACADWIESKAAALAGHILLLGTTMPPESALGLGITVGQVHRTRWPQDVWPIVHEARTATLVVPRLNLGAAALRDPDGR